MRYEQWLVYTNEQYSDQHYYPYALWAFDGRQPDPRPAASAVCAVYTVILKSVPAGHEMKYRELIERKLNADCCVVHWQHIDQ